MNEQRVHKQPRVAQGHIELSADVPREVAEFSREFTSASFAAGADDVTVTCTSDGTVTARAKRTLTSPPTQQQAPA